MPSHGSEWCAEIISWLVVLSILWYPMFLVGDKRGILAIDCLHLAWFRDIVYFNGPLYSSDCVRVPIDHFYPYLRAVIGVLTVTSGDWFTLVVIEVLNVLIRSEGFVSLLMIDNEEAAYIHMHRSARTSRRLSRMYFT
ncbi:uncharacterized protein VTP21DRAFT_5974 [Calcarisporiella thermophila]|uniref:uncharacterized protein n=1 Tax=Calcarisporiella thermophila TaxID=911321 RepID=UPI0037436E16